MQFGVDRMQWAQSVLPTQHYGDDEGDIMSDIYYRSESFEQIQAVLFTNPVRNTAKFDALL